jgi:hypothetical protein
VLIAGAADARLEIDGNGGTLESGAGSATLTGNGNGILFDLGPGTAAAVADGTGDIYDFAAGTSGGGTATIDQSSAGVSGTLEFAAGVTPDQIWFDQDGSGDLVVTLLGSDHSVTINGWFASGAAGQQLSLIDVGGFSLGNAQITQLEAVMATYHAANPAFDPATASAMPPNPPVQAALAALWHA